MTIISDCCYSGVWVEKAEKTHSDINVHAASGAKCKAVDNQYSKRWLKSEFDPKWICEMGQKYGAMYHESCSPTDRSYGFDDGLSCSGLQTYKNYNRPCYCCGYDADIPKNLNLVGRWTAHW